MQYNLGNNNQKETALDKKEMKLQKQAYKARLKQASSTSSPSSGSGSGRDSTGSGRDSMGSTGSGGSNSGSFKNGSFNIEEGVKQTKQQVRQIRRKADTRIGPCSLCILSILVVIGSFASGTILGYLYNNNGSNGDSCDMLPEYGVISTDYCDVHNDCEKSWDITAIDTQTNDMFDVDVDYISNKRLAIRLWNSSDWSLNADLSKFAKIITTDTITTDDNDDGESEMSLTTSELLVMSQFNNRKEVVIYYIICLYFTHKHIIIDSLSYFIVYISLPSTVHLIFIFQTHSLCIILHVHFVKFFFNIHTSTQTLSHIYK